jgi:hypothetical protein
MTAIAVKAVTPPAKRTRVLGDIEAFLLSVFIYLPASSRRRLTKMIIGSR